MSRERPILFSAPMVRAILAGTKTQTRRIVKVPKFLDNLEGVESFLQNRDYPEVWMLSVACPRAARGEPCADDPVLPHGHIGTIPCPYGGPRDVLWVKEAIRRVGEPEGEERWCGSEFIADGAPTLADCWPWKNKALPSIHMPRWASRLTLSVESVRVERLQDISEEDARAEGVEPLVDQEHWTAYDPEVDGYPEFLAPPPEGQGLESIRHHPAKPIETAREAFTRLWNRINGDRASWASNPWVWVVAFSVAEVRR